MQHEFRTGCHRLGVCQQIDGIVGTCADTRLPDERRERDKNRWYLLEYYVRQDFTWINLHHTHLSRMVSLASHDMWDMTCIIEHDILGILYVRL